MTEQAHKPLKFFHWEELQMKIWTVAFIIIAAAEVLELMT